jgi:pimeloyl-ACP methyl ester carboxylesterase
MWCCKDSNWVARRICAVRELLVERDGAVLAASYSPAGDIALVALHGAGVGAREYFLYEHLHQVLPPAGIGVVTFDRRGEGESTGDASRGRFDVQVGDALAVREAIEAERVGLWGVSQGGWIGPLAAAASDRVAFLVLIAAAGVTPGEQMFYANACQLRLAGYDESVVERARSLRRRFEDWVHGDGEHDPALAADLLAALDEPWFGLLYLPPVLFDEEGRGLWIEEMDFDPRPIFDRVRVPTLLFYGEADSWTPVEPSVAAWHEALGDAVDIVVIPGAEHELTLPDGTLAPEYERTLVEWLSALG